ncbi:MAG: glycerol-3-phosphate responsive antiterminator [Hespellia sp.]|nr:glycerol-3-phosphate responsive antiterminator [Hespellia sp.]
MNQRFYDAVEASPVIAAVKDMQGVEKCCGLEDIKVIFILFGDVCSIGGIVKRIKDAGKIAMVHMDLVIGLSSKEVSVDFIKENTHADGIISTKPALIKRGKELSLYTILRFFIIDSLALKNVANVEQQQYGTKPDFIEVLPGVMPKIIKQICKTSKIPVIAGGLVMDKEDVMSALGAGAISVSTTNENVWFM